MQFKRLFGLLVPGLVLLSLYSACKKSDFENPEFADHSSEFAFPLFTTTINLEDLVSGVLNDTLSNDTLLINPDGTMTLFYTGDVAAKPATDIFKFFDGGFFPLFDSTETSPVNAPDGVVIYQADLKSGDISLTLYNTSPDTLIGEFIIPQMSKNGVVFRYPFIILPGTDVLASQWLSPIISVADYVLLSPNNTLEFKYEAYRKSDGVRVNAYLGIVAFQNLKFRYLEGYWGFSRYPLTRDTIDIDINQTQLDGNVKVKNPKITMRIANSWGFPTRGIIKYLSFIGQDGLEHPLETTAFVDDSIIDFNYPKFINGEVGQTKYTEVYLDETNSNIAEIFNSQPTQFIYEVNGVSNAQMDPSIIGFMTDMSVLSLSMRVELTLEGSAQNFGAEQTLDLNFGSYSGTDSFDIESVEFKLVTENGTPISTDLQIFFQDEAGNVLDSLFEGGPKFVMNSAPVNAEGVATGNTRTETLIPMSRARFDRVRKAKRAILQTAFTTADGGTVPVKLLATNEATVKMGLKIKTRL